MGIDETLRFMANREKDHSFLQENCLVFIFNEGYTRGLLPDDYREATECVFRKHNRIQGLVQKELVATISDAAEMLGPCLDCHDHQQSLPSADASDRSVATMQEPGASPTSEQGAESRDDATPGHKTLGVSDKSSG
ncbi:hypothetical protein DOTSEDRAFT_24691 [Dothistroma septosporum NZE10]|uniref:Uncharacterized protein n=1 Tax=Dothistroma septosporum (strain NZE10 / CBS 128990) TaxID=675120 RepID=N1PMP0_DOTSN|nr:hypothetical protein DOTSEDRAFT_24691 [Dothistroma septosporum NZE10]